MYLTEKSLTANKYPRQTIAVVIDAKAPSAALRPLAIRLSFLKRMPRSEAMMEYAVTTQARARANWPICAAMFVYSLVAMFTPAAFSFSYLDAHLAVMSVAVKTPSRPKLPLAIAVARSISVSGRGLLPTYRTFRI